MQIHKNMSIRDGVYWLILIFMSYGVTVALIIIGLLVWMF